MKKFERSKQAWIEWLREMRSFLNRMEKHFFHNQKRCYRERRRKKTFNFRLLGIKDTEEELNVAGLNKSDLAEIKMKLELARKWAENQGQ
ncbi:hypothetical protein ACFS07_36645 [Undibacterium arcticum]